MAVRFAPDTFPSDSSRQERRRSSGSSGRFEQPSPKQSQPQRHRQGDGWSLQQASPSVLITAGGWSEYSSPSYSAYVHQSRHSPDEWMSQQRPSSRDYGSWQSPAAPSSASNPHAMPFAFAAASRASYQGAANNWPGRLIRRISSEDTPLSELAQGYYAEDIASSVPNLSSKNFPQRRPSNRDEFDGPSQFLDRPKTVAFEPTEDEMPVLPVSLHAQEQDDILSQVNDRLSQCAFDFVAKYQFPIPIESDKRPVRVANDREWSEWVYLLKRLATKRRIPSRVLYNGQIKQFITILENSLEMRHAAKHQSRPLKDDRNVLQLISSGIQVAKILKDAPAMQVLDRLYVDTERRIRERYPKAPASLVARSMG